MAIFQKRHYEVIAQALRENKPTADYTPTMLDVQESLQRLFAADNPRFDELKFHKAIGWGRV